MPGEIPTPPPLPEEHPERAGSPRRPDTFLGRLLHLIDDARAIMGKSPGRRSYDKRPRRAIVFLAFIGLLELVVRLGWHVIDSQFTAYDRMATTAHADEIKERKDEHAETIRVQERTAKAIEEMAKSQAETNATMRALIWVRETTHRPISTKPPETKPPEKRP